MLFGIGRLVVWNRKKKKATEARKGEPYIFSEPHRTLARSMKRISLSLCAHVASSSIVSRCALLPFGYWATGELWAPSDERLVNASLSCINKTLFIHVM